MAERSHMALARRGALVLVLALVAACSQQPEPEAPTGDPLRDVEGAELYRRGLALAQASHFVRAEQYFTAAIARGVPEEEVLPALIRVCVASSRLRAALSHAEPYLQRNPAAWSLRYLVASLHLGLGEVDRARAELEQVVRDAPEQPEAYYLLGLILRDEVGDRPAAAKRFASYLELAPEGEHAAEVDAALQSLRGEPVVPAAAEAPAETAPAVEPAPATSTPTTTPPTPAAEPPATGAPTKLPRREVTP